MKCADELPREQLAALVGRIQAALWRGDGWDADRAWDAETVEQVASVLEEAGLRPDRGSGGIDNAPGATPAADEKDGPLG